MQLANVDKGFTHRVLPQALFKELAAGALTPLLNLAVANESLSLNLRSNGLTLYYRGGNILTIKCNKSPKGYTVEFNKNYVKPEKLASLGLPAPDLKSLKSLPVEDWIQQLSLIKTAMDIWFCGNPKQEREYQQALERTNNSDYSTDYFICDVEYTHPTFTELRADLIGLRWPSTAHARRARSGLRLSFIEMKCREAS